MRIRCPGARLIGPACLPRYRFALMGRSGYATVRPQAQADVHGLLFEIGPADLAALDLYEDVENSLYRRSMRDVLLPDGGSSAVLIYEGEDLSDFGTPLPGYMECIVAAAQKAGFPSRYVEELSSFLPAHSTPGVFW